MSPAGFADIRCGNHFSETGGPMSEMLVEEIRLFLIESPANPTNLDRQIVVREQNPNDAETKRSGYPVSFAPCT